MSVYQNKKTEVIFRIESILKYRVGLKDNNELHTALQNSPPFHVISGFVQKLFADFCQRIHPKTRKLI